MKRSQAVVVFLMTILGACKGAEIRDLKTKNEQMIAQLEQCQKESDNIRSQLANHAKVQEERDRLGVQFAQSQESLDQAKKRLEALSVQKQAVEKRLAQFKELTAKLRSMIDAGKLKVSVRDGQMVISLPDRVLFDTGSTEMKTEGQAALIQVGKALNELSDRKFQVLGHTDNVPIHTQRFASNWELSSARAVVVTKFLIEHGVDALRLIPAGASQFQPVAANDSDVARAQNRRIEIVLLPNVAELPDVSSLENKDEAK